MATTAVKAGAVGAAAALAYRRVFWEWQLRWGATEQEVTRAMPGDAVVPEPDFVATRAITVNAAPERVWPWLVQIGSGRAGWYAIDRIDNAGVPSATRLLPEHQHLGVGDQIPMVPGADVGPRVRELESNRRMLWSDDAGEFSWEWLLEPVGDGERTRLVNRIRAVAHPWTARMGYEVLAANGDIVMQVRMLRGIKRRAERWEPR